MTLLSNWLVLYIDAYSLLNKKLVIIALEIILKTTALPGHRLAKTARQISLNSRPCKGCYSCCMAEASCQRWIHSWCSRDVLHVFSVVPIASHSVSMLHTDWTDSLA